MRSKLTKTIVTIVFVVFLGLVKVANADAYYAYCHYKAEDGKARALIYIGDAFENAVGSIISESISYDGTGVMNWVRTVFVKVDNWAGSIIPPSNYTGYADAWNNDHCPTYLLYGSNGVTENYGIIHSFAASDEENLTAHKELFEVWYNETIVLHIESHTFPNGSNESGAYIEPRVCECDNGVKYKIAEGGDLSTIEVDGKNVEYYLSVTNPAVIDMLKTNECLNLNYSDNKVYLSEEGYYSTSIKCSLSSQTPIEIPKPKPEYNPPTVNDTIIKPLKSNSKTYSCGNGYITDIPSGIVRVINVFYVILQILVPIALGILGTLDLMKAVTSQKEDEIKKGQQTFVKRLIAAVIIFFVFILVKLVVSIFSNDDNEVISCMNCFLQGEDSCEVEI